MNNELRAKEVHGILASKCTLNFLLFLLSGYVFSIQNEIGESEIRWINRRPLSWDLLGAFSLNLQGPFNRAQLNAFDEMEKGEYGRVYATAWQHFSTTPNDVWGWILVECAKKQKNPGKLVFDLEKLHSSSESKEARLLRFRALHLDLVTRELNRESNQGLLEALQKRVDTIITEMANSQPSHLPSVAALMGSQRTPVQVARRMADVLAKDSPTLDASLLKVRSLIRGRRSYIVYPGADPRSKLPQEAIPDSVDGPKLDEALVLLDQIEKRFPRHSLLTYYKAMCFAYKSIFVKVGSSKRAEFKSKAIELCRTFRANSRNYPALAKIAASYIETGKSAVFSPLPDE